ncbi:unnamed protein product [Blepharisma stoltei]|uniref:Major facilitator superfamily (MFS) profile domain-containing protein n=1 Tax=Blepharisma stoltei TaxID=1481888 RepID=A0AAU9JPI4_9CILI|nr:unnamed protein product [Blepharisma stoltei]
MYDNRINTRCIFAKSMLSYRFLRGIASMSLIPLIWVLSNSIYQSSNIFFFSWVFYFAFESLSNILIQMNEKFGLSRLLYISYVFGSIISGTLILIAFLLSDVTGIILFFLGRSLQGLSEGLIFKSESHYIQSICQKTESDAILFKLKTWYFIGAMFGSMLGFIITITEIIDSCAFLIFFYIIISVIHFIYSIKTYPKLPPYFDLKLGSKVHKTYFGLSFEDHYQIAKRDMQVMHLSDRSIAKTRICGVLIISLSGFANCMSLAFLYSDQTMHIYESFDSYYIFNAYMSAMILAALAMVFVRKLKKYLFIYIVIYGSIIVAALWLCMIITSNFGWAGLYLNFILLIWGSLLLNELSNYQAYLIIGPKSHLFVNLLYLGISSSGYIFGAFLAIIFEENYINASILISFFMASALLILAVFSECQEHPEFVEKVSQHTIRELKYPFQSRKEASDSLLHPLIDIPDE